MSGGAARRGRFLRMPTLVRFTSTLAVLAAVTFAAMFVLAGFDQAAAAAQTIMQMETGLAGATLTNVCATRTPPITK